MPAPRLLGRELGAEFGGTLPYAALDLMPGTILYAHFGRVHLPLGEGLELVGTPRPLKGFAEVALDARDTL